MSTCQIRSGVCCLHLDRRYVGRGRAGVVSRTYGKPFDNRRTALGGTRARIQSGQEGCQPRVAEELRLHFFVLVLAVTVATVLAKGLNDVPKLNGVSDVIVTKCRQLTTGGHFVRMCSIANELTMPNLVNHIDKSENWPHSCAKHTVSPRPSV